MDVQKDLSRARVIVDFFRGRQRDFPGGDKSGETSFYPLETKIMTFFAKRLK